MMVFNKEKNKSEKLTLRKDLGIALNLEQETDMISMMLYVKDRYHNM